MEKQINVMMSKNNFEESLSEDLSICEEAKVIVMHEVNPQDRSHFYTKSKLRVNEMMRIDPISPYEGPDESEISMDMEQLKTKLTEKYTRSPSMQI